MYMPRVAVIALIVEYIKCWWVFFLVNFDDNFGFSCFMRSWRFSLVIVSYTLVGSLQLELLSEHLNTLIDYCASP